MNLLNYLIILTASHLFAHVVCSHSGNSHVTHQPSTSSGSFQQLNRNETLEWYSTKYKVKRYTYLWNITNCSRRLRPTDPLIISPSFPADTDVDFKWSMVLFSRDIKSKQTRNNLSIYFTLKEWIGNAHDLRARYKFSLLDEHGNHLNMRDSQRPERFIANRRWGFDDFTTIDALTDPTRGLLVGDKLTIYCEIHLFSSMLEYSGKATKVSAPTDRLSKQMEQLYRSQKFTDLIISVGEQQFKAHKAILAARSPVFWAMFTHNMRESQVNHLEVVDIHPAVFQKVLSYIYTGRVSSLQTNGTHIHDNEQEQEAQDKLLVGLLVASDKYQLDSLGSICEQLLTRAISLESAGELLLLAETYNRPQLKKKVQVFMSDNYGQLNETN